MISKKSRKIVNRMLRMMKDIEVIYSRKLKLRSIGIANLKYLCGLGNEVCHDALSDAIDLKNVIRHTARKHDHVKLYKIHFIKQIFCLHINSM